LDEQQPGVDEWRRLFVAGPQARRQHAAGVVEAVIGAGELLEVAGDAMRGAGLGGPGDDAREVAKCPQQLTLTLVLQQLDVDLQRVGGQRDAELGRVAQQARDARVGVLHVEDRVVAGAPGQQVEVEVERGVGAGAHEGVARRVDAD